MTERDSIFWQENKVFIERILGNLFAHPENEFGGTKNDLLLEFGNTVSPETGIEIEKFLVTKDLINRVTVYSVINATWYLSRNAISILKSYGSYSAYLEIELEKSRLESEYRWRSIWFPVIATAISLFVSSVLTGYGIYLSDKSDKLEKSLEEQSTETQIAVSKTDSLYHLLESLERSIRADNDSLRTRVDSLEKYSQNVDTAVRKTTP